MDAHRSRRSFLARVLAGVAALPFAPVALAQALAPLSPDAPNAQAMTYTPDAATAAKDPAWKPGSHCGNCQFFTAATGACQIFPGSSVKPAGWCMAWAKHA